METIERSNLLGDRWESASAGAAFEVPRSGATWAGGRWPRSGAVDVERALAAARAAGPVWSSLGRSERVRRLTGFHGRLEAATDAGELAGCLGLEPEELRPRLDEELFRLREGLELLAEGADADGAGIFQAHWSDLAGGLGARLAARLVAGHTAVVLADPRLPEAAHAVARAVEQAELPAGVVSVLHDDTGEALRAGLGVPGLAWARLRGSDEELARLAERAGPFAASWSVWPLRNTSRWIAEHADAAREAIEVVAGAFGRAEALSGQLPGQVGRVVCHERVFSRFSVELLRRLEDAPDVARPVPAIDGQLLAQVRRAWVLGLDEGATPIFGGEPFSRSAGSRSAGSPEAELPAAGRPARVVPPVVFTNVEPGQGLARRSCPAPVLALLRAPSDEEARRLARELDDTRGRGARKGLQQGVPRGGEA